MSRVRAEAGYVQLFIHADNETPEEFLPELLHAVFKIPVRKAINLAAIACKHGQALCGTFNREAARKLLEAAQARIQDAGHPLLITSEPAGECDPTKQNAFCKVCGSFSTSSPPPKVPTVCQECMDERRSAPPGPDQQFDFAFEALAWHFGDLPAGQWIATARQFPGHMRADLQLTVDKLFAASPNRFFGIHERERYETLTLAALSTDDYTAPGIAPAQYHDVDIGDARPVKCLENGLWLCEANGVRYAVLLSVHRALAQEPAIRIEIAVAPGAAGAELVRRCFSELERAVKAALCYRGKILSLNNDAGYRGLSNGVMVHKLATIRAEEVILPEPTLKLLDRNVLRFVKSREQLRRLGQSCRKGILLYGPPGTGKTHTVKYLASNLPDHTTVIITAAQIGYLNKYMDLARLLQPSIVVIEDVDLIARDRDGTAGCEQAMLNDLLNHMDGLKEDADILFILTTNRPEQLEGALAGRPGRIDQAIEVPLPDEAGRRKLVQLYGKGLPLGEAVVSEAAQRTSGVSAAFIKELMRRIAQASIIRDGGKTVESDDISEALEDMMFTGGALNTRLLGGAKQKLSA